MVFFFFQAEDGIRDVAVTGVQTCALPIFFAFLYVLSVTGACMLLSRTGGLAMAGGASVLYAGVVLGRTVLPTSVFFESPGETSAPELLTMFLNAGAFPIVAIVAGGVAEEVRAARQ